MRAWDAEPEPFCCRLLRKAGVQGTKFYIGFHEGNLAFKRALVRVWGLGQGLRV